MMGTLIGWLLLAGAAFGQVPGAEPLVVDLRSAEAGTWDGFFVDHQPDAQRVQGLDPRALALGDQAQGAYGRGDYEGALRGALGALDVLPDCPAFLLLGGTAAFRLRRHGDVRVLLERFLEVAPGEAWRTQVLGHALYSLGEYAGARDHYQTVLKVVPSSFEAHRGLGLSAYRLGENELAVRELRAAVAIKPKSAVARAWLAEVLFDGDALEEALAEAQAAIAIDAFEPRAYHIVFRALYDLGRDKEAEQTEAQWARLTKQIEQLDALRNRLLFEPGDIGLHMAILDGLASMGDAHRLSSAVAQMLSLPADGLMLLERGLRAFELLRQVGAESQATTLLDKLTELFPEDPRVIGYGLRGQK